MSENRKRRFLKSGRRKSMAFLLSLAMVITMVPMNAMADDAQAELQDAAETVTVRITDSTGVPRKLAVWTYDSKNETYIDNATGKELDFVKDFSQAENLKGEVNGEAYDFTDLTALVYTGTNKKPDCRAMAVDTKGMLLEDVYEYAGNLLSASKGISVLKSDDVTMYVGSGDGAASNVYTYSEYWGQTKYYYPDWYTNDNGDTSTGLVPEADQTNARVIPTTLAIKGFHATTGAKATDLISKADTYNSLRIMIGQQKGGADKKADANLGFQSVKNIDTIQFTLNKTFAEAGLTDEAEYDWDSTTWAGGLDFSWYDENDVKTEYHITTPAQWEALAWICSESLADLADYKTNTAGNVTAIKGTIPTKQNTFTGVQFYLDNDIDMGGVKKDGAWSGPNYYPVGSQGTNDLATDAFYGLFYGSFDGQGHIVKNIYCVRNSSSVGSDGKGSQSIGLFGRIGAADDTDYPAANIVIENIAASGYIVGYRSAGGVVGKTLHVASGYTVTVQNCLNFADVTTKNGAKGIGGVIGTAWNGVITKNCANFGNITGGYRTANAGGVVGAAESGLTNSYNVGMVTNTANAANTGAVALNQSAGDVVNCYALEGSAPGYTTSIVNGKTFVSGGWKTEAEMKDDGFAAILSGDDAGSWVKLGSDYEAVSKTVAELAGEYPVPATFAAKIKKPVSLTVNMTKTSYTAGDTISKDDITVTVKYDDATEAAVTDFTYDKTEALTVDDKQVKVSYKERGVTVEGTIDITVTKKSGGGGSGGSDGPDTSGLDLTSRAWDGKTVDVSWYFGNESDSSYTIKTAAELAGVAALVNGLVNSGCVVYTGDAVISSSKWNSSKYVNVEEGTINPNNKATSTYHYGIETFKDKTIELKSNLDMSGGLYMPIGGQYLMDDEDTTTKISASFCGMFEGGGHTVNIECDRHCSKNYGDGESIGFIGRLGVHDNDDTSLRPSGAGICELAVTGSIRGNRSIGGIVGKIGKTKDTATIERCANHADITGTDAKGTGGICGAAWNNGAITDCYNTGKVVNTHNAYGGIAGSAEFKITNCYNVGKVSGAGTSASLATSNGGDSYENCYWLTGTADMGVYNKASAKGVTEMTSAQMKETSFADTLGSSFKAKSGDYPVLAWEADSSSGGGSGGGGGGTATDQTGTQDKTADQGVGGWYTDVASGSWYYDAVKYVTDNSLMNGTGDNKFSPSNATTRGMIMTTLARMSGEDTSGSSPWYQKGLSWAVAKSVSDGTNPEKTITREQLATMLYRYAKLTGYDTSQDGSAAKKYSDYSTVSSYAAEAMEWAVGAGLITGVSDAELQPKGSATRAQIATILTRWSKSLKTASDSGDTSDSTKTAA